MQTITPPHIYSAAMPLYRTRLVRQVLLVHEPQTIGEELVKAQSSCCKRQAYQSLALQARTPPGEESCSGSVIYAPAAT